MRLDPNRRTKRKMRTAGQDLCSCGYLNCDSMHDAMNTPYIKKLRKRRIAKVCYACGNKECKCKRKMENGIIYTDELREKRKIKMLEHAKERARRFEQIKLKRA